jgi:hypothetical protein
MGIHSY